MQKKLTIFDFYKVALPTILASLTTPLLGIADIAVIGNLGEASLIAGVTVGTQIFDTIYWVFGNIRFIASGQSSQTMGTGNRKQRLNALLQPMILIGVICIFMLIFRNYIFDFFMMFIQPELAVVEAAKQYYHIVIYACFFVLGEYIIRAWLFGQGKTVLCMWIQIVSTGMNIGLNILFVLIFYMGMEGVAWATFISQLFSFSIEIIYLLCYAKLKKEDLDLKLLLSKTQLKSYIKMSGDIFLRTIFHTIEKNGFIAFSSGFGTSVLSANGIFNQTIALMVYPLDALGNTVSIYAGFYLGKKNKISFHKLLKLAIQSAGIMAIAESIVFGLLTIPMFYLYTNIPEVLDILIQYKHWIWVFPVVSFLMDIFTGFYSGCTYVKPLRNATFLSMLFFFGIAYALIPLLGNDGLWIAQCSYWLCNAIILALSYRPMCKKINMI